MNLMFKKMKKDDYYKNKNSETIMRVLMWLEQ